MAEAELGTVVDPIKGLADPGGGGGGPPPGGGGGGGG